MLERMDKAAFMLAWRFARLPVVTASIEKIDFHAPGKQGQIVDLVSRIVGTGRTLITIVLPGGKPTQVPVMEAAVPRKEVA